MKQNEIESIINRIKKPECNKARDFRFRVQLSSILSVQGQDMLAEMT